jgi:transposase
MPWKETGPVLERTRFIIDYLRGCFTIAELAARYGVSRKTLYKWLARHDRDGLAGLSDRPRIAKTSPQRTAAQVAAEIVAFKRRFPFMGPLVGETIGLEEIVDGIWSVYHGEVLLARFDEREKRFYG